MTELRTPNLHDVAVFSAAQWNNALRGLTREIQDLFLRLLFGDDTPSAGDGGVVGGLVCSAVTGQLQTQVTAGWAFRYDGTIASPRSKFGIIPLHSAVIVDHDPNEDSDDRIDVISIVAPTGTDTTESVLMWESAPQNLATQRGAQASVVVTKGTPDASPVAPSTPAGHVKLFEVLVEGGWTLNLDSAVYTDKRVKSRGLSMRDADDGAFEFITRVSTGGMQLLKILGTGFATESSIDWDRTLDWPRFYRGKGGSGEQLGELYPMLIPSDRTWWRSVPWTGRDFIVGSYVGIHGTAALTIARSGQDGVYQQAVGIPADARGLQVIAAKARYQCTTAFDGTIVTRYVKLYRVQADGTSTEIGTGNMTLASTQGSVQTISLTMAETPVIAEGDTLHAIVGVQTSTSGSVGEVKLYSIDVQFKEGRA